MMGIWLPCDNATGRGAISRPGHQRWTILLANIACLLPARGAAVLIDAGVRNLPPNRLGKLCRAAARATADRRGDDGFAAGTLTLPMARSGAPAFTGTS